MKDFYINSENTTGLEEHMGTGITSEGKTHFKKLSHLFPNGMSVTIMSTEPVLNGILQISH